MNDSERTPSRPTLTSRPALSMLLPRGPTEEEWAQMSAAQREQSEEDLCVAVAEAERRWRAALTTEELLEFTEGDPHLDAKIEARETLRAFYGRIHRSIYIAADLAVLYPGETSIGPDLIAVRDVVQRKRDSWVVLKEGKGIDLALEILNKGNRKKDLVENLKDYARLGIEEYFVFDLRKQRLLGYRLSGPGSRRYTPILGNTGRYRSEVLELELAVVEGQLRFYMGTAELSTKDEELLKLSRMVQQEQARAEQEQTRAEQEQARAEQEQARAEQACAQLAEGILALAGARGLGLTEAEVARIHDQRDVGLLARWMTRAATLDLRHLTAGGLFLDS